MRVGEDGRTGCTPYVCVKGNRRESEDIGKLFLIGL
jgi:hypothetical protein